ncbi:MAG: hypothetical protein HRU17_05065 [Polyangiaceae bacterium]|nr:hypothetical protein [Polyangiaceae bacterium]
MEFTVAETPADPEEPESSEEEAAPDEDDEAEKSAEDGPMRAFPGRGFAAGRFGGLRFLGNSELLSRQNAGRAFYNGSVDEGRGDTTVVLQGGYQFAEDPLRDLSGLQLLVTTEVASGVEASALYLHELREDTVDLFGFDVQAQLAPTLSIELRGGASAGATFVPNTELAALAHGALGHVEYTAGVDANWFSDSRQYMAVILGLGYWFSVDSRVLSEHRIAAVSSDSIDAWVSWHSRLGYYRGDHDATLWFAEVNVAQLPEYRPEPDFREAGRPLYLDLHIGTRHRIGENYGLLLRALGGRQFDTFFHTGADVGLFLEGG